MDTLQKIIAAKKKKDKPLSDVAKEAKMSVVKDMQSMASGAMKDSLKGAGPLPKAEGTSNLESMGGFDTEDADTDYEDATEQVPESPDEGERNGNEFEGCSEEELDAKLAQLMEVKKKLEAKKE